jgi:tetratricopeptide (TPR) repeat protein
MRPKLVTLLLLFLACLIVTPQLSHAEDKAKALRLLKEGDALLDKGDRYWAADKAEKGDAAYEEALKKYNDAYKAFKSPQIFFPIAEAEQKLFRYLEAMGHYKALLKESDTLKPELVEQADAAIVEVRKELSGLSLTVEQDGAVVKVDDKVLGKSPINETHYFLPGRHTYSVTLDGHTPHEETMETKRGEVLER